MRLSIVPIALLLAFTGCSVPQGAATPTVASIDNASAGAKRSYLYVAGSTSRGSVTMYQTGSQRRLLTVKCGPTFPRSIVVDASGRLYVPYWGGIGVFSGRNKTLERTITTGTSAPFALALDAQQNLYVANNSGEPDGSVSIYSPGGRRLLRRITNGIAQPVALAFDKDENLYVANRPLDSEAPSIAIFPKGARKPVRTVKAGVATPYAIAVDAKETLYVLNGGNVEVYPARSTSPSETITSGIVSAQALAIDGSGKLYVGNAGSVTVYEPGSTILYRVLKVPTQTTALAFDDGGRLYVATAMRKGTVFVFTSNLRPMPKIGKSQGVSNPNALAVGVR